MQTEAVTSLIYPPINHFIVNRSLPSQNKDTSVFYEMTPAGWIWLQRQQTEQTHSAPKYKFWDSETGILSCLRNKLLARNTQSSYVSVRIGVSPEEPRPGLRPCSCASSFSGHPVRWAGVSSPRSADHRGSRHPRSLCDKKQLTSCVLHNGPNGPGSLGIQQTLYRSGRWKFVPRFLPDLTVADQPPVDAGRRDAAHTDESPSCSRGARRGSEATRLPHQRFLKRQEGRRTLRQCGGGLVLRKVGGRAPVTEPRFNPHDVCRSWKKKHLNFDFYHKELREQINTRSSLLSVLWQLIIIINY